MIQYADHIMKREPPIVSHIHGGKCNTMPIYKEDECVLVDGRLAITCVSK